MNDIYEISKAMQEKIKQLDKGRSLIKDMGDLRAEKIAEYEKELAKTIIGIKNSVVCDIEGMPVKEK